MTNTTHSSLFDGVDELPIAVYMALGGVSTCWTPDTGNAVFDSVQASQIGEELLAWISAHEQANLGLATTRQLLVEVESRMQTDRFTEHPDAWCDQVSTLIAGWLAFLSPATLDYRTVDS